MAKEVLIALDCENFEAKLSQYLEEELNPWETRAVTNHLVRCVACSQALEGVLQVRMMLGNLASLNPPPKFELGLAGYLGQRLEYKQRAWRRALSLGLAFVAALAILLWPESEPQTSALAIQEIHQTQEPARKPATWSRLIAPVGEAGPYSPAHVQLVAFQQEPTYVHFSR